MTARDYGSRLEAGQKLAEDKHENSEVRSPQSRPDCCNPHFLIDFPDYAATVGTIERHSISLEIPNDHLP